MKNSEFLQAVKQSVIKGPWGKGTQFTVLPNDFATSPNCVMGHAVVVTGGHLPFQSGTVQLCRALATNSVEVERWNDAPKTTRWDVIAKLEQAKQYWLEQGQ